MIFMKMINSIVPIEVNDLRVLIFVASIIGLQIYRPLWHLKQTS